MKISDEIRQMHVKEMKLRITKALEGEENFKVDNPVDTLPSYSLEELANFQIQDENISKVINILSDKITVNKLQVKQFPMLIKKSMDTEEKVNSC